MKLEQAARQALEALEELFHSNSTKVAVEKYNTAHNALREALAEQVVCKECGAKQAQIDRLMLEHCPDEMTTEQMQEWGNNQQPSEQAEQEPMADIVYDEFGPRIILRKSIKELPDGTQLFTAPVRTKDLTDDEIADACGWKFGQPLYEWVIGLARAVIAADREKNE